jgi:hypothetical protein
MNEGLRLERGGSKKAWKKFNNNNNNNNNRLSIDPPTIMIGPCDDAMAFKSKDRETIGTHSVRRIT